MEMGREAISSRVAFGAEFIKEQEKLKDEGTVTYLSENPFAQYFVGLKEFQANPLFKASISELDKLMLAYATTIHKAQGSEYPVVIMPVLMSHYVMLQRNLVYTGITRAKKVAGCHRFKKGTCPSNSKQ